ncbi:fimbrial protein [Pseudomonas asplenii]|uniref:Pilin (Type 1 fimbria component protein) n=1 Tax=Pseudomonas asplenii TaxID=53407 RepID=A0A1H6LB87_9PSED|nr:fimbrial protein [Pseudomonas fuscovaginae]SEH85806.1 Pilin (type 1 fimbria component protein) [Pseudomonas fuscovaginae]
MIGPYQAIPTAALLLCISGQAFAACSSSVYHPGGYSGDIGTVTVTNIDGPVGSTLSGWRDFPSISQGTKRVSWYCSSRTDVKFSAQGAAGAVSSYSEAGRTYSVYPTGMPGIGIVFKTNGNTQVGAHNTITGIQSNITQRRYSQTNLSASNKTYAYEIDYRLIKTGSISSGNIIPRVIARTWWEPVPTNFDPREYNILLGRGTIIAPLPTCDLNVGDTNRTITLDTVRLSNFTGNWLAKKTFDISANCRNASNVTFRFTGTPATGNATLFRSTGTAAGVGLWLYSRIGGVEATLSNNGTRTVTVSNDRAVLPLGAAYHKTTGTLTKGSLVSTVTVNITYN